MPVDEVSQRLDLSRGTRLGEVVAVDGDRITVEIPGGELAARVTVSDLVAVVARGGFLVGIAAGLARPAAGAGVLLRVMPVGSFTPRAAGGGSFRLGAERHPHVGAACHLVEGPELSRFMGVLGREVAEGERLVLGHYVADRETEAVADGNRLLQRHLSILGNTGAGKSWSVALLLERAARLRHANLVVLDLHGEYAPLAESVAGAPALARRLRVAGPADLMQAGDDVLHLPYWLLRRDELASLVLNPSDPHVADQRLALTDRIQTLKRAALTELGQHEATATATVDSPVPYRLSHLLDWLARDEVETIIRQPTGHVDPGPFNGRLGGMISRLEAHVADPRYAFIFHPPERTGATGWLVEMAAKLMTASGGGASGIKIVDLSEVPAAIVPMVAGVLGRLVYDIQFWMDPARRTPVCVVCDEAHTYLPAAADPAPVQRVALDAYETIAKEGRKYGVCLAVVSQRPSDVSRTILSQCNNFVVMRLTNDEDQEVIAHVVPGALSEVRGMLPMLDVGEALVLGDAVLMPVRIKLDAPAVAPSSATLPYWSMWSSRPSSRGAIADGVRALRNQWRERGS